MSDQHDHQPLGDLELRVRALESLLVEKELVDPAAALEAESFVLPSETLTRGDSDAAIAAADHRLEGRVSLGGQDQFYLEGQIAMAIPREDGDLFEYISIRTPVPKGNVLNAQDSLFQQGYYIGDLPDQLSVMPPFNVDHTIAVDIERIAEERFANSRQYDSCVGDLRPFGPLEETVIDEDIEPRLGVELEEIYDVAETPSAPNRFRTSIRKRSARPRSWCWRQMKRAASARQRCDRAGSGGRARAP